MFDCLNEKTIILIAFCKTPNYLTTINITFSRVHIFIEVIM